MYTGSPTEYGDPTQAMSLDPHAAPQAEAHAWAETAAYQVSDLQTAAAAPAAPLFPNVDTANPTGNAWGKRVAILAGLMVLVLGAWAFVAVTSHPTTTVSASDTLASGTKTKSVTTDAGQATGEATQQESTTTTAPVVIVSAPTTKAPPTTAPATTAPPTTAPPTTAPPTTTPPTTAKPVLKIGTFSTPANVDCSDPMKQVPYIPLSWTTQNAVKVTVSIDGPGIYKTYNGPTGNDTVPFACPGSHTYLLTAYAADNTTATQTVTITKK